MNYEIKQVHISEIKKGDTILHTDGNIRTVSKNNIKKIYWNWNYIVWRFVLFRNVTRKTIKYKKWINI